MVKKIYKWFFIKSSINSVKLKRDRYPDLDFSNLNSLIMSFMNLISEIIERWFFLKRSVFGYWNSNSMNKRFIGSIFISALLTLFISNYFLKLNDQLCENKLQQLATFAAIFSTLFWNERASYYSKWIYLANLYNEVIKEKPFVLGSETDDTVIYSYKDSLTIALALDIVQMEMWSHDSFKDIIESCLIDAFKFIEKVEISKSELFILTNNMTKKSVINLLLEYQEYILNDQK